MLVDGSSLIFRAYYGVPQTVRAPDGRPVNAVRGFLDNLARLLTERRPRRLAVASDEDWRPPWRVELIPSYKAHRTAEPVPPGLIPQLPVITAVLAAVGVDFVGLQDYEAEDVIATWTARAAGGKVEIVSGDRDLFALVQGPNVKVLYPEKGGLAEVDEAEVQRRYGVPGRLYADFAVLRGDPSDGLTGMAGVGPKKAAELVQRYGGIQGLIESGRVSGAVRDYLERAYRVVAPVTGLPLELPEGCRSTYPVDPEASAELAERNGLVGSVGRLVTALRLPR
jgi:5'-3' exonuclease